MTPTSIHDPDAERLQKVLARAGVGSRRSCEELITAGRVTVDGQVIRELGTRVDPTKHRIAVDGEPIQADPATVTMALHKPAGVVSTMKPDAERPTLAEYVAHRRERLFHVGRLDAESEGLILLSNDGELAKRLTHPTYGVPKTYVLQLPTRLPRSAIGRLKDGIELDDGPANVDSVHVLDATPAATLVEVVLHSGRNRVLRRMFAALDIPIDRLVRTGIGPIKLGDLKTGRTRVLSPAEVSSLMSAVGL
ncbi:MAG: rRNA pseudouridine synthase [Bifidobacteriaceae bacterium]|jgi:23S rRNA pseudouridine2605 synthase|nr:rRNA pseudouridine synthase [Bifidobacteriaceae bacterium]